MILRQLVNRHPSNLIVQRLVGDDLELYQDILKDDQLKSLHLSPLAGVPENLWLDKAKLALASGFDPQDVANATYSQSMSWSGEESRMWSQWVEHFDRLLSHEDEKIHKVGELGKSRAEASRDRALSREREEAIHGLC